MGCKFNITFLGDEKAGKTALSNALVDREFNPKYAPTIGAEYCLYEKHPLKLHIWDTSGNNKRFGTLTSMYHQGADVFVYVVDTTRKVSESLADTIVSDLQRACLRRLDTNPAPILLVGSKQDLAEEQGIDASSFLDNISSIVRKKDPTLNLRGSYIVSAKTPLKHNKALQHLVADMEIECEQGMNPNWWVDAYKKLKSDISELSLTKKRAIDAAIKQLQPVILSQKSTDEKIEAISIFKEQCDNALGDQYLFAKKALYVFTLTAICSLIALGIAASFGVSGMILLATVTVVSSAGAGAGLLTKNSLFKPISNQITTDFVSTINDNVNPNASV